MKIYSYKDNLISLLIGGAFGVAVGLIGISSSVEEAVEPHIEVELINVSTDVEESVIEAEEIVKEIPEDIIDGEIINAVKDVKEPERVYLGVFKTTAYCSCSKCCGSWADGVTASGTRVTEGRTIAVDPREIPLGSVVEINGHTYIAEDTGGGIKSNRIDIYFSSHQEALRYGIQNHEVYLVMED